MSKKLYTIGHSNLNIDEFIELLHKYQITALADVRSHPYSRYLPHFNKNYLQKVCKNSHINYVFLGEELGARTKDQKCYINGKAVYEKIAATELFKQGIKRIIKGSKNYTIALMCAEKDPITCHRAILICQHLRKYDLEINHILSNGTIESHQDLEDRLLSIYGFNKSGSQAIQLSLFDAITSDKNNNISSPEDYLQEAYLKQGNKIAYVEKN